MKLLNKKIVLSVTGGIAAYKAVFLVRLLLKRECEVQVLMTPSAQEFVGAITFSSLTQKPVYSTFFEKNHGTWNNHVEIGLWADVMIIVPATANTIGKMAYGLTDNIVVATYLSARCPVFIAPAMDVDMFHHPSVQRNLEILSSYGNHIIEPDEGELASKLEGKGRMKEPAKMIEMIESVLK